MGAAFSLLNPSLMLIAVGRVSEDARGAAMGTYTAFFDAGVGLGAPIAGLAAALTDYEGAFIAAPRRSRSARRPDLGPTDCAAGRAGSALG